MNVPDSDELGLVCARVIESIRSCLGRCGLSSHMEAGSEDDVSVLYCIVLKHIDPHVQETDGSERIHSTVADTAPLTKP